MKLFTQIKNEVTDLKYQWWLRKASGNTMVTMYNDLKQLFADHSLSAPRIQKSYVQTLSNYYGEPEFIVEHMIDMAIVYHKRNN
jgi:hypothetical protein